MTQLTSTSTTQSSQVAPTLHYQVAMPQPASHLFEVRLTVSNWQQSVLHLKLPVWTPGSYLVREYARHIQGFVVRSPEGRPLNWHKLSKNHWRVETEPEEVVEVQYQVFAHELTVRTNHLDITHGYFNPAALCLYLPGWETQGITLTIQPPVPEWQVITPLPAVTGQANTFFAADYDTLVDSPVEVGTHRCHAFTAAGKEHQLAVYGDGNLDIDHLTTDIAKIIAVEADLFGGLPYERYLFLLHLAPEGNGGLEHKFACSLNYTRFGFRHPDRYNRFLTLVAHEFFHLWNVKRILPQELVPFDYDGENYTPSLWFSEGTTSYYDQVFPLRAGIYDAQYYLKLVAESITRLQTAPGRLVQPLRESSFDAWIKLYRPDANSRNSQISYYLKGELVSLLLDLLIRQQHQNQRSLDDVMRQMWQQFGQSGVGFSSAQLQTVIENVAGTDLSEFCALYLDGVDELPFDKFLEPFGLQLVADGEADEPPYLGITAKAEASGTVIKFVAVDSPAQQAGITPGDELLAIAGYRVTAEQLNERLKDFQPGDRITLTVFQKDQLKSLTAELTAPVATRYKIVALNHPSEEQQALFKGWLGTDLAEL